MSLDSLIHERQDTRDQRVFILASVGKERVVGKIDVARIRTRLLDLVKNCQPPSPESNTSIVGPVSIDLVILRLAASGICRRFRDSVGSKCSHLRRCKDLAQGWNTAAAAAAGATVQG